MHQLGLPETYPGSLHSNTCLGSKYPIHISWTFDVLFTACSKLFNEYCTQHSADTTLGQRGNHLLTSLGNLFSKYGSVETYFAYHSSSLIHLTGGNNAWAFTCIHILGPVISFLQIHQSGHHENDAFESYITIWMGSEYPRKTLYTLKNESTVCDSLAFVRMT